MKKTVIALHGNPGTPGDWDSVRAHLGADHELIAVDPWSDAWLDRVRQGGDKKILLAFSWGCYRVLKNLKSVRDHVERVVLVAPTLDVEKKLSPVARAVLSIPAVGDGLLKSSHAKAMLSFVEHMVAPRSLAQLPSAQDAQKRLKADWQLWKKAAFAKIDHQNRPLTAADAVPVQGVVLFGDADHTTTLAHQRKFWEMFPSLTLQTVPKEGHGLPWTQPELIAQAVAGRLPERIGYYPGENARNNVITYMEKHLAEHPDRIALRWVTRQNLAAWNGDHGTPLKHDQINYRDFALRINSFAQGLLDIGIKKGDRVIIFLPMSLDMYTSMFAVQRIGAIAVFLDSWARSHHLGASAECVGPKAMISFKQAFDLVDQVPEFKSMPIRIMYGPGEGGTHQFPALLKPTAAPVEKVESEATALITFTTGSTGKPKGANRTHRFLSAQHTALNHVIPYTEADADMPAFPIFSLNNLAAGVTTILPALDLSAPSPKDPAILATQILHENITCTTLSPSMLVGLARYCQEKGIRLTGLRRVVTGGAPISKDDVRAFYAVAPQTDLWILYGSTEAEPMAHIEGREMLREEAVADPEIVENGVNVGHISEDVDYKFIRIINGPVELKSTPWSEIEVPRGEVGEFLVTGDHVCRDYYNNPDAFKSTKIEDLDGRVWHRTGDLCQIDDKGNLWIVGRVNNAVERKGRYYFPVQAEVLLKRMDFTARCAFLGLPHPELGQANWGVVELKPGLSGFDAAKARAEIRRVFEKNGIPLDEIRFIDAIPMDPRHHSKVEYAVLRKRLQENPHEGLG